MEKITKRNMYTALVNFANDGELTFLDGDGEKVIVGADALAAFAENEIALLDKKAEKAKERNKTKAKEENPLRKAALEALTDEFTPIADITAAIDMEDVTVAKVTYQLNALVKDGMAEKQPVKIAGAEGKKARTVQGYRVVSVG